MPKRILTAREQYEMGEPWRREAMPAPQAQPAQKTALLHPQFYSGGGPFHLARLHEAIPKRITPKWEGDVWNHVMRNPEGITVRDQPGDEPSQGIAVSRPGNEEQVPFHMLLPQDLGDYARGHREQLKDDSMGGWRAKSRNPREPSQWYQDVTEVVDDPWLATQEANKGKQDAMYDFNPRGRGEVATEDAPTHLFPERPELGFWLGSRHG